MVAAVLGCGRGDQSSNQRSQAPISPDQAEAETLGRELFDIVDRVMAYRSSHRGNLPVSYRQAGIDSLTPQFVRRLSRQGNAPVVTIAFRRPAGQLLSCEGTNLVLEEKQLRDGAFTITCRYQAGGTRVFTVPPPPPPPKKKD